MGLASFNRMRREAAEKIKLETEQHIDKPKSPNSDLTTPQIKEKLDALGVAYIKSAKKDELLALLDDAEANQENSNNDSEQAEDESQQEDQQPE